MVWMMFCDKLQSRFTRAGQGGGRWRVSMYSSRRQTQQLCAQVERAGVPNGQVDSRWGRRADPPGISGTGGGRACTGASGTMPLDCENMVWWLDRMARAASLVLERSSPIGA